VSATAVLFSTLAILLIIGMPMAYALSGAALLAVIAGGQITPMVVTQRFFTGMDSFTLMAIPFFIIAGVIMQNGGVSKRLVNLCNVLIGNIPGSLAIVTVLASGFFGALTGTSTATVAAVGGIMIPAMLKAKYDDRLALATTASAGYVGIIIPPSIVMITYGLATGTSVGTLFMAGIIPGIILVIAMAFVAYINGKKKNLIDPDRIEPTPREKLRAVWEAIPAILMPFIILGGIYGGVFTPTEAAAVAILYGLIVGLLFYRELKIQTLFSLFLTAGTNSAKVMFILAGAMSLGFIMTREMIPVWIAQTILSISGDSVIVFLLLVNIMLLLIGSFMEANAAVMIIAPVLLPVLNHFNINMVHFGIIMTVNLAIGMITPPIGMNLVVASSISGKPVERILNKYFLYYLLVSLVVLFILTYWAAPVMFLPELLGRR